MLAFQYGFLLCINSTSIRISKLKTCAVADTCVQDSFLIALEWNEIYKKDLDLVYSQPSKANLHVVYNMETE